MWIRENPSLIEPTGTPTMTAEHDPKNENKTRSNGPAPEVDLELEPPTDPVAEMSRERDDYLDQLRRTQAEFLNYQKRAKQQADTDRQYAITGFALDLLAVLDNFERALAAAKGTGADAIVSGIEMVEKQLVAVLQKHGVEAIPALDQPFDPNLHEAIVQQPNGDVPEGTVVAELGKGYRIKERVLRPTKVAVSIKPGS